MHSSLITRQNMDIKCLLSTLKTLNHPEFCSLKALKLAFITPPTTLPTPTPTAFDDERCHNLTLHWMQSTTLKQKIQIHFKPSTTWYECFP